MPEANPIGRPSTFKPEYCDKIVEVMAAGYSKTAFAGSLGTSRQTLISWSELFPEFLDAVKRGEAARVFFLETGLLAAPDGSNVTSRIFALKNAAPDEWKDKHETVHANPDGSALTFVTMYEGKKPA